MIPLITCEMSFGQHVSELVFGVNVFDLDFVSKLIRSNNQSRATLWVLETCLMVGLLPLRIILITASLSSNTYNKASWREHWTFEGTRSTLSKSLNIPRDCLRPWFVRGQTTGLPVLSWFSVVFPRTRTIRSHKSRAGKPSRRLDVWGNGINILHHIDLPLRFLTSSNINRSSGSFWSLSHASKNRKIRSQNSRAGKPSNLSPVSKR